ncbi:unnamed protein product, partial [Laminaria digitata]
SLLVVEAIHAWQEATKHAEVQEDSSQRGCGDDVPTANFEHVGGGSEESFWNKQQQAPANAALTGEGTLTATSREVRFPIVPLAQVASTAPGVRRVNNNHFDPPIFLWFPPMTNGLQPEGSENRRSAQEDSMTSNPEGAACDLRGQVTATATTAAVRHTSEGGEGGATGAPSAPERSDENSCIGGGGGGDGDAHIPAVA